MNRDILKGRWLQFKGRIKREWGKLTDDDLDLIQGSYEMLVGRLQEHYGRLREEIERELARQLKQWTKAMRKAS